MNTLKDILSGKYKFKHEKLKFLNKYFKNSFKYILVPPTHLRAFEWELYTKCDFHSEAFIYEDTITITQKEFICLIICVKGCVQVFLADTLNEKFSIFRDIGKGLVKRASNSFDIYLIHTNSVDAILVSKLIQFCKTHKPLKLSNEKSKSVQNSKIVTLDISDFF